MPRTSRGPKAVVGPVTPVEPEAIPVEEPARESAKDESHLVVASTYTPLLVEVLADGTRIRHFANGDVQVETPTPAPYRETF